MFASCSLGGGAVLNTFRLLLLVVRILGSFVLLFELSGSLPCPFGLPLRCLVYLPLPLALLLLRLFPSDDSVLFDRCSLSMFLSGSPMERRAVLWWVLLRWADAEGLDLQIKAFTCSCEARSAAAIRERRRRLCLSVVELDGR